MTRAVQFVFLHPLVALAAAFSLTLTVLTLIAHRSCLPRWSVIATLASLFGRATVVLCLLLGLEVMTITRIAATRPGTSREEQGRFHSLATNEFLAVAGAGLLLGMPGALVGPFLRRRRVAATPGEPT